MTAVKFVKPPEQDIKVKPKRIIAYSLGFIVLAFTPLVYLEYVYMLGFPDGFITDLEHAARNLAYVFIGISFVIGVGFIYLGATGKGLGKKLSTAMFGIFDFRLRRLPD